MPARAIPLVSPFQEDEEELMISGFELMQNGNWEDAASVFMKFVKSDHDAPAINNHGLVTICFGRIREKPDDPAELPFSCRNIDLASSGNGNRSSA